MYKIYEDEHSEIKQIIKDVPILLYIVIGIIGVVVFVSMIILIIKKRKKEI